jgi:ribosomal protein S18 acetylase RimI-like enzyme
VRKTTMDMLIKLYAAGFGTPLSRSDAVAGAGVVLRKPIGPEHLAITHWVAERFGTGWASEVQVALANRPVSVWIATQQTELLGFVCFDATARGFVGPIGVADGARGQGVGAALLRACLDDMRVAGYGYAIAGAVGAPEFFRRVAGATAIADSTPGLYEGQLKP